jgi:hypothetical protein
MKRVFQIAVWVIVIGGIIVGWQECKRYSERKAKSAERAKEESTRKAIIELADKYNAVADWKKPLSKIWSDVLDVFTMEVEDALLRKDNRPVLFLAQVKDVERKEGAYTVRFWNEFGKMPQVEFVLDCSDEQVRKITQQQRSQYGSNYAVIAAINKVKKVAFEVTPVIEGYGEETHGKIEIDTSDAFVASGHCIDLLFVEYYSEYDLYPDNTDSSRKTGGIKGWLQKKLNEPNKPKM